MSISSETSAPATPPASSWFSLPRFPASWAVESAAAEGIFARLLWLLVPLQYYVVTNIQSGLSDDDLIPAVALSLVSVAVIFLLSCVAAWCVSVLRPPDPSRGDTLTGRVRMWVVALMVCTAAGYLPLALSLAVSHFALRYDVQMFGDFVTDGLIRLLHAWGVDYETIDSHIFALQTASNFAYAFAAVLVITLLHRALARGPASPAARQEPGAISVGLIVGVLMTAANYAATRN